MGGVHASLWWPTCVMMQWLGGVAFVRASRTHLRTLSWMTCLMLWRSSSQILIVSWSYVIESLVWGRQQVCRLMLLSSSGYSLNWVQLVLILPWLCTFLCKAWNLLPGRLCIFRTLKLFSKLCCWLRGVISLCIGWKVVHVVAFLVCETVVVVLVLRWIIAMHQCTVMLDLVVLSLWCWVRCLVVLLVVILHVEMVKRWLAIIVVRLVTSRKTALSCRSSSSMVVLQNVLLLLRWHPSQKTELGQLLDDWYKCEVGFWCFINWFEWKTCWSKILIFAGFWSKLQFY